jgi:hypothetical protein
MSKKVPENSTLLYATFSGYCVDIIVRSVRARINNVTSNMVLSGFMLDECDEFYYVGETPAEVTAAIRKIEVVTINLAREELGRFETELNSNGDIQ